MRVNSHENLEEECICDCVERCRWNWRDVYQRIGLMPLPEVTYAYVERYEGNLEIQRYVAEIAPALRRKNP